MTCVIDLLEKYSDEQLSQMDLTSLWGYFHELKQCAKCLIPFAEESAIADETGDDVSLLCVMGRMHHVMSLICSKEPP